MGKLRKLQERYLKGEITKAQYEAEVKKLLDDEVLDQDAYDDALDYDPDYERPKYSQADVDSTVAKKAVKMVRKALKDAGVTLNADDKNLLSTVAETIKNGSGKEGGSEGGSSVDETELNNLRSKYRYYAAYMLTLTTGCRRGEVLGLMWKYADIGMPWGTVDKYFPWGDIRNLKLWDTVSLKEVLAYHNIGIGYGYVKIVNQMADDNGYPLLDELKTDLSRRTLMITEEMVLLLIFWRMVQNKEKQKALRKGKEFNNDDLVFCTRNGGHIYPRNFTKMWGENLKSMGIEHKRFHDLRHTVATVMLEDGEAMNTVQEQLGHYDAGFTASRYGHVTAKMKNSAAVKLGDRMKAARGIIDEPTEPVDVVQEKDKVTQFPAGTDTMVSGLSAARKIK